MSQSSSPRCRKSRAKQPNGLPKGAVPLPNGNYMLSGPWSAPDKRGRRIRVRAEVRAEPDVRQLAHIFMQLAEEAMRQEREQQSKEPPVSPAA